MQTEQLCVRMYHCVIHNTAQNRQSDLRQSSHLRCSLLEGRGTRPLISRLIPWQPQQKILTMPQLISRTGRIVYRTQQTDRADISWYEQTTKPSTFSVHQLSNTVRTGSSVLVRPVSRRFLHSCLETAKGNTAIEPGRLTTEQNIASTFICGGAYVCHLDR